jgi:hypothetical protein
MSILIRSGTRARDFREHSLAKALACNAMKFSEYFPITLWNIATHGV